MSVEVGECVTQLISSPGLCALCSGSSDHPDRSHTRTGRLYTTHPGESRIHPVSLGLIYQQLVLQKTALGCFHARLGDSDRGRKPTIHSHLMSGLTSCKQIGEFCIYRVIIFVILTLVCFLSIVCCRSKCFVFSRVIDRISNSWRTCRSSSVASTGLAHA